MHGLKALVTVMSLLLLAGMGLLVYGMATRTSLKTTPGKDMTLSLPARSTILHMSGYDGGIALHIASPQGEYIYLIDPGKGSVQNRIALKKDRR